MALAILYDVSAKPASSSFVAESNSAKSSVSIAPIANSSRRDFIGSEVSGVVSSGSSSTTQVLGNHDLSSSRKLQRTVSSR